MKMKLAKKRPRVLILSTNGDEAGAPIHVYSVVSSLGSKVDFVVVFGEDGAIAEKVRRLGIPVVIVPQMRSAINISLDIIAFRGISKCVEIYKPDLIHAHSSKAGMIGRVVSFRYGVPCIYTVHGWGWRGLGVVKGMAVFLIEKILSFVPKTYLIYVSRSVEGEGIKKLLLSKERGVVIHNGVADLIAKKMKTNNIPLQILMPARVSAAKDHMTLIKAFEEIKFPSQLFLCGAGTDSVEFIEIANQIAPKRIKDIFFLGPRSDVPELLHNSDIFVLSSNFEALPISIIEAMSAEKSIIASDVGGVRELIDDGLSGLCVEKGNVKKIVEALNYFHDASFRKSYGIQARKKYLLNFTLEAMAEKIFSCYSDLIIKR